MEHTELTGARTRNQRVDLIRAVAMLLVVLGHTMCGCTADAERSFLYDVVWSLQMPLFFLISGYVTKYSRQPQSVAQLLRLLGKRTASYLLPFMVWTFLLRAVVFGQHAFLNVPELIYHMDTGYWFLFSLWVISLIFLTVQFLAAQLARTPGTKRTGYILLGSVVCFALLGAVVYFLGGNFLCSKITMYYLPFYMLGFLFGSVQERLRAHRQFGTLCGIAAAVCGLVWLFLLNRYELALLGETPVEIVLRMGASVSGCVFVCVLLGSLTPSGRVGTLFTYIGRHSLEIYLIHDLLLCLLRLDEAPAFSSVTGLLLCFGNYAVSLTLTLAVIWLLDRCKPIRRLLFWK